MRSAHHRNRYLYRLPEFKSDVMEVLYQPLGGGELTISLAAA
jgi:predicted ATPase with chaperone activity